MTRKTAQRQAIDRVMNDLAGFQPYSDLTEESAITPRMKELLTVTTKVKRLDSRARHYLAEFLSKRHKLLLEIMTIDQKYRSLSR